MLDRKQKAEIKVQNAKLKEVIAAARRFHNFDN